jgi:hypothetical protein
MAWTFYNSSGEAMIIDGAASSVAAASQAEQVTSTEAAKYVAPLTQQYHPTAIQTWVHWEQSGANSIRTSRNYTSVVDGGAAGDTDHLFSVDFTTNSWAWLCGQGDRMTVSLIDGTEAAGGCTTITNFHDGTDTDRDLNSIAFLGELV